MPRSAVALLCTLLLTDAMPAGQSLPPDTTDPDVRITSPVEDATVSGAVTITADATDDGGVAGVSFEVDGAAIGAEDTAAPWSITWNAAENGAHLLTAVARDTVGNAVRSAVVVVVVGDGSVPVPPPTNHNPIAVGDSLTSIARAPVTFTASSLLANDTDPDGHALSLVLVAGSSSNGGTVVNNGDGTWTYTPASMFAGLDTFTYSIGDGFGGTASAPVNVNVTPPAPPGLVLALAFDENAGATALDASGGDRNGTIEGAERVSGKIGGALSFDGVDDWVTVPDAAALDLTAAMTLEAWVQPTATYGWESVLMKERGPGDLSYALYANDGAPFPGGVAAPAGYVRVNAAHEIVWGTSPVVVGSWTHLAATYDGTTLRLYVDGALVSSRPLSGAIEPGAGPLRIGGNTAFSGESFAGLIDEVRIYNRALDAAEIAADMAGMPPPPPPPANTAPVAQNDSLATTAGTPVSFTAAMLLSNDSDPDGDPIGVSGVAGTSAAGGTITSSGTGSWTYAPASGHSGADSFTYSVGDGRGGTATATVNVTVNAPPPPPPPPGVAGLVLALGFNEATGLVAADSSGGGRNGTIRGAVHTGGKFGGALQFDGVDDWVTVADAAALDLTTGMTLEAWVRPTAAMNGWETVALKQRGTGDLSYALYAHDGAPLVDGVAAPAGYVRAEGGHQPIRGASALPIGAWTHLAAAYDGAALRIYVNGVLVASRDQVGLIAVSGGALRIGGNSSFADEFFQGLIDELRVYNRALSGGEIQADMNTPIP